MTARSPIESRIRLSGWFIAAGLLVQLASLMWSHPLAFLAFLLVGTPLVAAGALLYLFSLVTMSSDT